MRGKTADIIKSHCGSEICFPNKMAFDKTWIVLIAGCGVLGLAIWGGMNAMTLKMTLLWMFISFGFLTLIMHLFGSPISVLLGNVFKSSADGKRTKGELKFIVAKYLMEMVGYITYLLNKMHAQVCP